jgi:hypothetical protein
MSRRVLTGFVLAAALGCQLPPEQDAYRPLREHGRRASYEELAARARRQADVATEAFYGNNWGDLQDVARALEQTARLLPDGLEPPEKKTDEVRKASGDLGRDAARAASAVRALDRLSGTEREKKVNELNGVLTSINKAVRALPRKQ